MAWNFRRRIKILPGVHLNVGKRGVSTSFGTKGAHITTGENGTYLNTGIPGTGLYNRQKIGGGKKTRKNGSSKGDYNKVFMWMLLMMVAAGLSSVNKILGIGFFLFVVVIKITITCLKPTKPSPIVQNQEKETTEKAEKQLTTIPDTITDNKDSMKNEITEAYFTSVTTEVENIIELLENLSDDIYFLKYFRRVPECAIMASGGIQDREQQIKTFFWMDMTKCFVNLGHPLNMKSKENFGLFYFFLRTMGVEERMDFWMFDATKEIIYERAKNVEEVAQSALTVAELGLFTDEVFGMSKFLGEYDSDLQREYLRMLHRCTSLAAKADGAVTEKETEWLNKIWSLYINPALPKDIDQKETKNEITEEYFTDITAEVEKLIVFKNDLLEDASFLKHFDSVFEADVDTDANEKLKILFCRDMTKCFVDLGHHFNIKSKEGFGLFYFFICALDDSGFCKMNYEEFGSKKDMLYERLESSMENLMKISLKGMRDNPPPEGVFWISWILRDYDRDLQQKYLVMLYRYSSLTAKADGVVTDVEAAWLNKILKLSENPVLSIESDGEKENSASVANLPQENPIPVKPKTAELKSLIGLHSVKVEIETLTNFIKIQQQREAKGLKTSSVSYHCVFTGNPGTGKTTVARIVADVYKSLGVLVKGHLVETDRSGLVAEYVGQTAVKTNKIIDSALDGVLFIDEAYSLISESQNDYGKEAIATLLKRMEDDRSRLVVILAGYSAEMQQFIDSNPGLQSRFNRYIDFPDYSAEELYQIFEKNAQNYDYTVDSEAEVVLKKHLEIEVANKGKNFGNARFVRNLFEKTIERQANRLSKEVNLTNEKLTKITTEDLAV